MPTISLRLRLTLIFLALSLLAMITASFFILSNARSAVQNEVDASWALAHALINQSLNVVRKSEHPEHILQGLPIKFRQVRHIRINVLDGKGHRVTTTPTFFFSQNNFQENEEKAPSWFHALLWEKNREEQIPIVIGPVTFGHVVLRAEPSDEVDEIWADVKILMKISGLSLMSLLVAIHLALGHALKPINNITEGLLALEQGNYKFRISKIGSPELSRIGEGFNALARRLDIANKETEKLSHRLVSVQDLERRTIAQELHDEFGPCLFGIKSNASSVHNYFINNESLKTDPLKLKVQSVLEIINHMESCNRDLLNRLRPMALGEVNLSELIEKLVGTYQGRHGDMNWVLRIDGNMPSYSETIDLTVYRFVQESLTNVVRHSQAQNVKIEVRQDRLIGYKSQDTTKTTNLHMLISDDGLGFSENSKAGHGIIGLEERIEALGGTLLITENHPQGVKIEAHIQFSTQQVTAQNEI
ncbi:MAG: histidine kinase [Rhodomicrobiaceae bacterium]